MVTEEEHVQELEEIARKKGEATTERQRRREEKEANKKKRDVDRRTKAVAKLQKKATGEAKKRHAEQWSVKSVKEYGDRLHALFKSHVPRTWYPATYSGVIPTTCKENQKIALERRRADEGEKTLATIHLYRKCKGQCQDMF